MAGSRNFNPMSGADGNGGNRNGDADAEAMKSLGAAANEAAASVQKLGSAEEERTKKAILAAAASVSGAQATRDNAKALEEWNKVGQLSKEVLEDYIKSLDKEKAKSEKNEPAKRAEEWGKKVSEFGESLNKAASGIEKFDPKLAETIHTFGEVASQAGAAATSIAAGFAAGGPPGAAIAASAQLVGLLANSWIKMKQEQAQAAAEYQKKADEIKKKSAELAAERGADQARGFLSRLEDETEALGEQNKELDENLRKTRERRNAQAEQISAQGALDLAKIDASDASDADKIRARAAVNERMGKEQEALKVASQNDRIKEAKGKADNAAEALNKQRQDVESVRDQVNAVSEEIQQLKQLKEGAARAQASLPGAEKILRKAQSDSELLRDQPLDFTSEEAERIRSAGAKAVSDYKAVAAQAGQFGNADAKQLSKLEGESGKGGALETLQTDLAKKLTEYQAMDKASDEANHSFKQISDSANLQIKQIQSTGDILRRAAQITSDSNAKRAEDRSPRNQINGPVKAESHADSFAREAGETARSLAGDKRLTGQLRADAEAAAKRLSGANPAESDFKLVERILSLISDRAANDQQRLTQVKALERKIQDLETRFKAERGRGSK